MYFLNFPSFRFCNCFSLIFLFVMKGDAGPPGPAGDQVIVILS